MASVYITHTGKKGAYIWHNMTDVQLPAAKSGYEGPTVSRQPTIRSLAHKIDGYKIDLIYPYMARGVKKQKRRVENFWTGRMELKEVEVYRYFTLADLVCAGIEPDISDPELKKEILRKSNPDRTPTYDFDKEEKKKCKKDGSFTSMVLSRETNSSSDRR